MRFRFAAWAAASACAPHAYIVGRVSLAFAASFIGTAAKLFTGLALAAAETSAAVAVAADGRLCPRTAQVRVILSSCSDARAALKQVTLRLPGYHFGRGSIAGR